MDRREADTYASWFRCLADGTRLQLLQVLASADEPMTIGQLVDAVPVGQSTVSGHVRRLEGAGFVIVERAGTMTYVRVEPDCLTALPAAAEAIMGHARLGDGPGSSHPGAAGSTARASAPAASTAAGSTAGASAPG